MESTKLVLRFIWNLLSLLVAFVSYVKLKQNPHIAAQIFSYICLLSSFFWYYRIEKIINSDDNNNTDIFKRK
jgi:hypothetical protein